MKWVETSLRKRLEEITIFKGKEIVKVQAQQYIGPATEVFK